MKVVYGWIYCIIDGTNDKEYVGQTTRSVERRFREHLNDGYYISNAMNAHGVENFLFVVLKECYSQEELNYWERHFIKYRDTMVPNGYNLTEGGEGGKPSDETLKRMSEAQTGEKNHFFDKHHTDETCSVISVKKRSESHYKNLLAEMDKRKLSYTSLAKLLGVSVVTLSDKMRCKAKFTERQSAKLENIFGLPAEYLLARDDGLPAVTVRAELSAKSSAIQRAYSPYKNLLAEMDTRNLSYTGLAVLLGLERKNLSDKMRGKLKFSVKQIEKLIEIFVKPAEYLMAREDGLSAIPSKAELGARLSAAHRSESPYKNLLAEMDKRQLSYTGLADLFGVSHQLISDKMSGKRKFTAADKARLEEIFGLPAEYLLARVD